MKNTAISGILFFCDRSPADRMPGTRIRPADFCGVTIIGNLKLDHDLACAGNGLIVGADGARRWT